MALRTLRLCALLLVVHLYHSNLAAQSVEGVLLELGTDRPIELGAVALLTMTGIEVVSVLSDRAGRFRLEAPDAGSFLVRATSLGYSTSTAGVLELGEGSSISIELRLDAEAIELRGLTIEARSPLISQPNLVKNGFVERVERGFGRFITPADIEKSLAISTTQLLSRTGRIRIDYAIGGDRIQMLGQMGLCTPLVYLDGVRISMNGTSLDAIAPVASLEAAEVYRSATEAPLRYGGGLGGCGIIVLWTRAR